jgi:hypothetical protein
MANATDLATNLGTTEVTFYNACTTTIPRGSRIYRTSSGYLLSPDATTRGDLITLADTPTLSYGPATLPTQGCVGVVIDGNVSDGVLVYASTTAGQCSPTSTNAQLMGRAKMTGANTQLITIELLTNA